ncbi:MAG: gamma-glutamyltransferase [Alphaproteobacteria bacterium]
MACLTGFALAACGSDGPPEGQVGFVSSDFGGVVSDEPRSALIGRDILSSGGNAIDAAVATYFALSVTYPGAASLGGGGICVAFRGEGETIETIDFRPQLFEKDGKAAMIPGAVRGMFALHARYGRMQWEALLLPAERLARFGNPVSRAFARRLAAVPPRALTDPTLRRLFAPGDKLINEGDVLSQFELSASLARIRLKGPGDFYAGDFAKLLAQDLGVAAGADVPISALRDYRPKWLKTEKVDIGKDELHLPGNPVGARAAAMWRDAAAETDRGGQAPYDSAGFVAVDRQGGGAACVVSTNGTLGAGKMIGPSGILMAAPPRGDAFPGVPMLLVNRPLRDARGAASGSGGAGGAARAIATARKAFDDDVAPDKAFGPAEGADGRAGVIHCPKGARENPDSCRFGADPAGHGLAVSAAL